MSGVSVNEGRWRTCEWRWRDVDGISIVRVCACVCGGLCGVTRVSLAVGESSCCGYSGRGVGGFFVLVTCIVFLFVFRWSDVVSSLD